LRVTCGGRLAARTPLSSSFEPSLRSGPGYKPGNETRCGCFAQHHRVPRPELCHI
ncbi:hypothetical protein FRC11_014547, partial [Ceratobasidium sp. 423]